MRIAIVGFEPEHEVRYPHLQATIDVLKDQNDVEYIYFKERGGYAFVDRLSRGPAWVLILKLIQSILMLCLDALKLRLRLRLADTVIAIDNLAYIIACRLHVNVILWSMDFITKDQERSESAINRAMSSLMRASLAKQGRLLIQDKTRERLFMDTFDIVDEINVYHLPVSLPPCKYQRVSNKITRLPTLGQVGGINAYRSASDQLVLAYQKQHSRYQLLLHGYFDPGIVKLLSKVDFPPVCSMLSLSAQDVYKILINVDIGFIYYPAEDDNFKYIGHASGQLCEYLRLGIPVLYCGETNLKGFVESNGIGRSIASFEDIPEAIQSILASYDEYSCRCKLLFQSDFNIDSHAASLSAWI